MRINPVSFGKIVRVEGSNVAASKIANLANSKEKSSAARKIKAIFDDTKQGKAKVFHSMSSEDHYATYIFSGKEAKESNKIDKQLQRAVKYFNKYNADYDMATILAQGSSELYEEQMQKLIQKNNVSTLFANYDSATDSITKLYYEA
ncbi:hypothetical protein IJ670_06230 [bacterium]|nr:hypothetical protein [bacterium]